LQFQVSGELKIKFSVSGAEEFSVTGY
jgi:hypothetical protein